ncbi:MAG: hypothetical protein JWP69_1821 [Flaviaesturariibacter sp.]|nr:hypothetical protein [Flaviaesturariibacter sp.]
MDEKKISELLSRISTIPGMMGGRPVIRKQRFTVSNVLELLASGMTYDEILEEHPILEKEDIIASLLYASLQINNTRVLHAA